MQPQCLLCPVRTYVHRIVPDRVGPLHLRPQRCPETALPRPGSDRSPLRYVLYVCTARVYCTCELPVCTVRTGWMCCTHVRFFYVQYLGTFSCCTHWSFADLNYTHVITTDTIRLKQKIFSLSTSL
jgi:hypothetical protein